MSYGLPGSFEPENNSSSMNPGRLPSASTSTPFNLPTSRASTVNKGLADKGKFREENKESETETETERYQPNNLRRSRRRVEQERDDGVDLVEETTYRSRVRKIVEIKNDNLKFEGERFNNFLTRYERTADAWGATKWDKVMQIDRFVIGEDLKEELEMMDGYEDRDWDKLKASMKKAWSDLFPKMKYTIQDLQELANECAKKGGIRDLKAYKNYAAKFMVIEKYLLTNEHISSDKDVIYIFLSAFPRETCINIKRELISNDKIKFSADGYCKPPALSDLLEFTEREIKAASDDAFGYGRAFVESNRVMQQGMDVKKGAEKGKALREKMVEENPVNKLEEKVEKMAKGIQALQQKLENSNSTEEKPRGNAPPSRTLYESRPMICFYCSKEGHGTQRCQELEADQREGLVQRIGKDYYLPNGEKIPYDASRPIRTVVATASAKAPP